MKLNLEKMQELGNIDPKKWIRVFSFRYKHQIIDRWRGKYSRKNEIIFKVGNYGFKTKDEAKAFIDS